MTNARSETTRTYSLSPKIIIGDTTMPSSKRFEGKTAFITGAASGIGRATAMAFAAEGARVAVTDRGEAALQETAEHVKAAGAEVLAITCDVSKPEEIQAAVARAVKTLGRIDCAFNNAGVENKATPLAEIEIEEWDRILGINLRGTFVCMKHELAQMLKQGGGEQDAGSQEAIVARGYQRRTFFCRDRT
jgi:NAD(P)-dependent dehydrogenase (short-subunit alcohol dehydrogenase family)